jgi:uncharacterized phage protein (TIGR01671 family)|nr:MAG TPA: YopX protein [Caudoviricetes sp.]
MERQIKFRAKHIKNGAWLYGDLLQSNEGSVYIGVHGQYIDDGYHFNDMYDKTCYVDEDTIGQFTGLLDRNGKEIYEGDIITVKGRYPRVVLWGKMMWALMPTEYYHDEVFWAMNLQHPEVDWWEEFADEFEIIGNIYDHPSLISDKR